MKLGIVSHGALLFCFGKEFELLTESGVEICF